MAAVYERIEKQIKEFISFKKFNNLLNSFENKTKKQDYHK